MITLTDVELLELVREEGFAAAFIDPRDIPVVPEFRMFCEENRCGKFDANYSCPPDCGTVEQLRERILAERRAIILTSHWEVDGYDDKEAVQFARKAHNTAILRIMEAMKKGGWSGFAAGYGGCALCNPCKRTLNQPCAFPEKRISCMSAYCINVAELAQRCGLEFSWDPGKLYLFGMIAYHEGKEA